MPRTKRFLQAFAVCLGAWYLAPATASALEGRVASPNTSNTATGAAAAPSGSSFELAVRYEHGEGVAQNYDRALALYCEAAEHNDARAAQNLGWMFLYGRGVVRNEAIGVTWFRKAADGGIVQAGNILHLLQGITPSATTGCPVHEAAPVVEAVVAPAAIREMVQKIAPAAGLEVNLVMAVISAESAFDTHAVSRRSAMGLMQLMPETAERFGVHDPFDPAENIRGGTTYLRWLLSRFRGNLTLALAAYNAGESTVDSYGGVPPFDETIQYIEKIKLHYHFGG